MQFKSINCNETTFIRPSNEILECILCLVFLPKLDVDITNHVVSQIITYVQALDVTIFAQLLKQIFVEILSITKQKHN